VTNPDCTRELVLDIPAEEVSKAYREVVSNYRKHAKIPGFRAGKVPDTVIKRRFGAEIRKEVIDGLLPERFNKAVRDLGISYPVAMDNNYSIWRSFDNNYWPAHYFIDATGKIRFHHYGEGNYDESEKWIRTLLEERNHQPPPQTAPALAAHCPDCCTHRHTWATIQAPAGTPPPPGR